MPCARCGGLVIGTGGIPSRIKGNSVCLLAYDPAAVAVPTTEET